jgi:hypothetical protein
MVGVGIVMGMLREENRYIEEHLVSIYDKWEG